MCVRFANFVLKTRDGQFGGLSLKTIGDGFDRFGPQKQGVANWYMRGCKLGRLYPLGYLG